MTGIGSSPAWDTLLYYILSKETRESHRARSRAIVSCVMLGSFSERDY